MCIDYEGANALRNSSLIDCVVRGMQNLEDKTPFFPSPRRKVMFGDEDMLPPNRPKKHYPIRGVMAFGCTLLKPPGNLHPRLLLYTPRTAPVGTLGACCN